jgi:colanic acid/amylovoran biosynthesis glycosyltransferase
MNTVISQAMATGLPVVTTNHSGLPEQVLNEKNGFVVPEGDSDMLAEKILLLVEHPELWPRFGRFGRNHAKQQYDSKNLIKLQIIYYSELLSNNKAD